MNTRGWTALAVVLVVCVMLAPQVAAMFLPIETENVPIDRIIGNLEKRLAIDPRDLRTRLNLARVHAMAWATKSDTAAVVTGPRGASAVGDPDFGHRPGFQGVDVRQISDPDQQRVARQHLMQAIDLYRGALEQDRNNVTAMLGQTWCLDQAGEKSRAIAGYRQILDLVWPTESRGGAIAVGNFGFMPTTEEVAGYLIPLLDPQKDAAEIATLRDHVKELNKRPRAVTPIVVPLRDDVPLDELIDLRARVTFDADGSGLRRRWTWVTPDAGWLVFDKHGTGQITSALQLFGSVTFWLFWSDGYDAMRSLDDNGDGKLSGRELSGLAIWRDRNGDGISDAGEVRPLGSWGIVALDCARIVPDDDPTLAAWSPRGVTFANGRTRPTYDVLLFSR